MTADLPEAGLHYPAFTSGNAGRRRNENRNNPILQLEIGDYPAGIGWVDFAEGGILNTDKTVTDDRNLKLFYIDDQPFPELLSFTNSPKQFQVCPILVRGMKKTTNRIVQ